MRFLKEMRARLTDLVISTQFIVLMMYLSIDAFRRMLFVVFNIHLEYGTGSLVTALHYIYFYLDLYIWYLMIWHIRQANAFREHMKYPRIKKSTLRMEICSSFVVFMFMAVLILTMVVLENQSGIIDKEKLRQIEYFVKIFFCSIFFRL